MRQEWSPPNTNTTWEVDLKVTFEKKPNGVIWTNDWEYLDKRKRKTIGSELGFDK